MGSRIRLADLLRTGFRAVSKYTGTLLTVFIVQSVVAVMCMFAIALVLAQELAHLPLFDEAVDGDLVAGVWIARSFPSVFLAIAGVVAGSLLVWQMISWFLVGGLVGIFAQSPEGRSDTARCFGASGASTYLLYMRLAMYSVPGILLVLFVLGVGLSLVEKRIEYALTIPQLVWPLLAAILPAALLLHFFSTVTDYARVELSLRHETHDPSVIKTYLRTLLWVLRRPITLVHAGIGWVLFLLVSLAYMYLAHGHPMYGIEGAITLYFVRQGVALFRMAIHIAIIAGQVELGRTRPLPPRRVELKPDAKT